MADNRAARHQPAGERRVRARLRRPRIEIRRLHHRRGHRRVVRAFDLGPPDRDLQWTTAHARITRLDRGWRPEPEVWANARPVDRNHACRCQRSEPARTDLRTGLHARRQELHALLRIYVAVHSFDARSRPVEEHDPALRLLGTRRYFVLPADRLLDGPSLGRRRCEEGVPDDQVRRLRVPARNPVPLLGQSVLHGH